VKDGLLEPEGKKREEEKKKRRRREEEEKGAKTGVILTWQALPQYGTPRWRLHCPSGFQRARNRPQGFDGDSKKKRGAKCLQWPQGGCLRGTSRRLVLMLRMTLNPPWTRGRTDPWNERLIGKVV
jgi:hypothetical protein